MSRLEILTTKFENLRVIEDKSISYFDIRLRDVANPYFALAEKMFEEKLAKKNLKSLPKKF